MSYLILVRHGQSVWNLEKKFTGWVDVDLTENGKSEAKKAGELINKNNLTIELYCSLILLELFLMYFWLLIEQMRNKDLLLGCFY